MFIPALSRMPQLPSSVLDRPYSSAAVLIGHSASILGSEEIRFVKGFTLGYGKREPRMRFRSTLGELVWEGYYERTNHTYGPRSRDTDNYGLLAMGRWYGKPSATGQRYFLSLGWGAQYATYRTPDLDSRINSTPVVDLGTVFPVSGREFMFAIRYLHASNAGIVGRNQGTNQILVMTGFKF